MQHRTPPQACAAIPCNMQHPMQAEVPALCVTAWAYILASVMMLLSLVLTNQVGALLHLVCPSGCGSGWNFPVDALWALTCAYGR
jgi:hypothetical protein